MARVYLTGTSVRKYQYQNEKARSNIPVTVQRERTDVNAAGAFIAAARRSA